jgi:hypothetical protein
MKESNITIYPNDVHPEFADQAQRSLTFLRMDSQSARHFIRGYEYALSQEDEFCLARLDTNVVPISKAFVLGIEDAIHTERQRRGKHV